MGLLVWQDFPSISDLHNTGGISAEFRDNFALEYSRWMEQRGNHPSIVLWVVFNEAWGQFNTVEVTLDVMAKDPSRLVTGASGWDDAPVGNIVDVQFALSSICGHPNSADQGKQDVLTILTHKHLNTILTMM